MSNQGGTDFSLVTSQSVAEADLALGLPRYTQLQVPPTGPQAATRAEAQGLMLTILVSFSALGAGGGGGLASAWRQSLLNLQLIHTCLCHALPQLFQSPVFRLHTSYELLSIKLTIHSLKSYSLSSS